MDIGRRIQQIVKERSISVSVLADALCCTRKHVYKIFQKKSLNTDLLLKISEALAYDFFAGSGMDVPAVAL